MAGRGLGFHGHSLPEVSRRNNLSSHANPWDPLSLEVTTVNSWPASSRPFLCASPYVCTNGHGETYLLLCVWVCACRNLNGIMLYVFLQLAFLNPQHFLEIMSQRYLQNHFVLFNDFTVFQSMNTSSDITLAALTKTTRWLSGPSDRPSPVCMYLHFLTHVSISGSSDQ